jgi:hypothetical protein
MDNEVLCRAPIGFIVEGQGEFNCYPSLVSKITKFKGKIPRSNAGGCNGIYRNLRKYLTSLVLVDHPYSIIVTVDFKDAIKNKVAQDCLELLEILDTQICKWLKNEALNDQRLKPLPTNITSVLQIQKFETWILSDISGLEREGHIQIPDEDKDWLVQFSGNVDELQVDPASWLDKNKTSSRNIKSVRYARCVISCLNPEVMQSNSRSFRKFYKEVNAAYQSWLNACGI